MLGTLKGIASANPLSGPGEQAVWALLALLALGLWFMFAVIALVKGRTTRTPPNERR